MLDRDPPSPVAMMRTAHTRKSRPLDAATPPVTSAPGGHGFPGPRFGARGPRSGGHGFPAPHFGGGSGPATAPRWAAGPDARVPMSRRRRGWLWAVAVVVAIAVTVGGATVTGVAVLTAIPQDSPNGSTATGDGSSTSADAWDDDVPMRLSAAMQENDRAAFVAAGDGGVAKHLAAIWDETKKLGWTLGVAEATDATGSVQLAFNMQLGGFHAVAADNGTGFGGELLATFVYDATITGTGPDSKLTALHAVSDMPWDRGEQIAVARGERVALFSDADEAALAEDRIPEAEAAAEDVLARPEWTGSTARLEGFVSYVTENDDDFRAAYGPDIADGVAGFCRFDYRPSRWTAEEVPGLASGPYPGGGLAVVGPDGLLDEDGYVFAHEFAHYMQSTYAPAPYAADGTKVDDRAFSEGYAEAVAAEYADASDELFTTREVRRTVLDGDVAAAVSAAAFDDSARVDTAYLTAGSYFYFLDQQHADYRALLTTDGTTPFVKEVDAVMPPGLRIADWRAWMAEQ